MKNQGQNSEGSLLVTIGVICREIISWILFFIVLWAMFSLNGCNGPHMRLDHKWEPLTSIQQVAWCPEERLMAIGDTVYVRHLGAFLRRNPKPFFEATMIHEQVHARRQRTHMGGVAGWCIRYVFSGDFAAEEENIAYQAEQDYLKQYNKSRDREALAELLRGYWNLSGRLWSDKEADKLARELSR